MAVTREKKVPALVDKPMDFCPGCGHGIISRLIMEALEELDQMDNIIFPIGVGCSSNLGAGLECDRLHCCHGRAGAVATGMKRVNPDVLVVSYQGDGDAYNIGIAETFNAAYRGENITVIVVNNTNFGMTGGQMSLTTMEGQKTATSVHGRDCAVTGYPIRFPEMVAREFPNVRYADLLKDKRFTADDFFDASHLNYDRGGPKLVRLLDDEIAEDPLPAK